MANSIEIFKFLAIAITKIISMLSTSHTN